MSLTERRISQLETEIANLSRDEAQQTVKVADLTAKINKATIAAAKATTLSAIQSRGREVERHQKSLASVRKKLATIGQRKADKSRKLSDYRRRLARESDQERRGAAATQRGSSTGQAAALGDEVPTPLADAHPKYDFFISHASEDKENFVEPLATALDAAGAAVWYDRFVLEVGDKLRERIDDGLASSQFGVVVLSSHFFSKKWPKNELEGLFAREREGQTRILPIRLGLSDDEIERHSLMLAGRFALRSPEQGIDEIVAALLKKLHRSGDGS